MTTNATLASTSNLRPETSKPRFAFWIGSYFLLLVALNISVVSTIWSYSGYVVTDGWALRTGVNLLVLLATAVIMPADVGRASEVSLWILFLLVICPVAAVSAVSDTDGPGGSVGITTLWAAGLLACLVSSRIANTIKIQFLPSLKPPQFYALLTFAGLVLWLIVISRFGIRTSVPRFDEIYDVRLETREELSTGGLAAYALPWLTKVLHPAIGALGLILRRRLLVVAAAAGQVFCFAVSAQKSVFLSIVFLVGVMYVWNQSDHGKRFPLLLVRAFTFTLVASWVSYIALGNQLVTSLFVRRFILTAGVNSTHYYEYFSQNETYQLRHSILAWSGDSPYSKAPALLIGESAYGSDSVSANANLFADGFANFGTLGVIGFGVLLGLFLGTLDGIASSRSTLFAVAMLALPSVALSNTALLTTLLTHGLVPVAILIAVAPTSLGHRIAVPNMPGGYVEPGLRHSSHSIAPAVVGGVTVQTEEQRK